jgi:hypothetical protein
MIAQSAHLRPKSIRSAKAPAANGEREMLRHVDGDII